MLQVTRWELKTARAGTTCADQGHDHCTPICGTHGSFCDHDSSLSCDVNVTDLQVDLVHVVLVKASIQDLLSRCRFSPVRLHSVDRVAVHGHRSSCQGSLDTSVATIVANQETHFPIEVLGKFRADGFEAGLGRWTLQCLLTNDTDDDSVPTNRPMELGLNVQRLIILGGGTLFEDWVGHVNRCIGTLVDSIFVLLSSVSAALRTHGCAAGEQKTSCEAGQKGNRYTEGEKQVLLFNVWQPTRSRTTVRDQLPG
mmetsp:Transcript_22462/g.49232  ORF Transcript_22462/g.49232 Transcript_22462/m.49232 type:complete len:254 (+) Transcript_22462:767-1528(+)